MTKLRYIAAPLLLAGCLVTPALAEPALWRVSDADSSIYLFGSVHLFTKQVDWRTPQFDSILHSADHVYFEVVMDIEAYSTITQITLTKGMFRDGRTLRDVLTPAQFTRLSTIAGTVSADMAALQRMQPWLATMTLMQGAYPKTAAGVETLVDSEVDPRRKRGLETAAEQMGFLSDAPLDEQVTTLMSTLDGIESGAVSALDDLIDAWQSGDTASLAETIEAQVTPEDAALYNRLLTDRNARWVKPLETLLATDDRSLVIVGAAHLVGPDGVPALLRDRGYTVERVDQSPTGAPSATEDRDLRRR
ncbi:TraB/GumN family protein [Devosia sp. CN2-171]|uniref:TraB/GumN family protein n=1 Tax=Devosia sp. CN2-171 TaxID=3400909 RepID=UPI003BF8B7EE